VSDLVIDASVAVKWVIEEEGTLALDHPAYDCVYIALAEAEGLRFVTADANLVRKAGLQASGRYADRVRGFGRRRDLAGIGWRKSLRLHGYGPRSGCSDRYSIRRCGWMNSRRRRSTGLVQAAMPRRLSSRCPSSCRSAS